MFEYPTISLKECVKQTKNDAPLLVLGMHRSGTSLLANWLDRCGFDMGDEMIGPGNGNTEGHFEDLQFYNLHKKILKYNRTSYRIYGDKVIHYPEIAILEAHSLYSKKKEKDCWGWKDPRTCLMLDLWNQVLPEYKTIIIYRDYRQVVDSLFRRKQGASKSAMGQKLQNLKYAMFNDQAANRFLQMWIVYNRKILDHVQKLNQNDFIVLNEAMLLEYDALLFQHFYHQWNYRNIQYVPVNHVFKSDLFRHDTADYNFDREKVKESDEIMKRMKELEAYSQSKLLFHSITKNIG